MGKPVKLALLSTYLPQKCGIATFTYDLYHALLGVADLETDIFAMSDCFEDYDYPQEVLHVISRDILSDYIHAAARLNLENYDVLCVQHEYGIFGGEYGQWLLDLLIGVRMPIVTTLHTVLSNPCPEQVCITQKLLNISSQIVVISETAKSILLDIYHIEADDVQVIAHGVPNMPLQPTEYYKKILDLPTGCLLLTFGLLAPSKGIEYMIDALPDITKACPNVTYLVLGEAHPHYQKWSGRHYAKELQARADALGMTDHFIIRSQFVTQRQLIMYLGAADIYITPYLSQEQVSSGALSYAKATNNALVSTPYWYAQELIASEKNGRLVDFKNSQSLSDTLIQLILAPDAVTEIARYNYHSMRDVTWPNIGRRYLQLLMKITNDAAYVKKIVGLSAKQFVDKLAVRFDLSFQHMAALTDDTGIFQHATFRTPNRFHGYCTDDNARALVVSIWASRFLPEDNVISGLTNCYLSFLHHAFDPQVGGFRNFMSFDRCWLESIGSEDCQGRAIWALGVVQLYSKDRYTCRLADQLWHDILPSIGRLQAPRAIASTILGLVLYDQYRPCQKIRQVMTDLLTQLCGYFSGQATSAWFWFEPILTYDNARIPQALIVGGIYLDNEKYQRLGIKVLSFLVKQQFDPVTGIFMPVGNRYWCQQSGYASTYDQQPIEACAMVSACLAAAQTSQRKIQWQGYADQALSWLLGENSLQQPICDLSTGACADGLTLAGINHNFGAESTLSWLPATLECLIIRQSFCPRSSAMSHELQRAPVMA